MSYGHGGFGDDFKIKAELVNGTCPTCAHNVVFISLCKDFFRCTVCGSDLEQKINGTCPNCQHNVVFVSLCKDFFRCTVCGIDLEQKINGKISYIPTVLSKDKIRFEVANESKKI